MLSHLKRRFGVLAAVAVLAALVPTLSTSPASAVPAATALTVVGSAATYSACPTGSAAAAGFTDTTSTDVDCVAMYNITLGTTATTYSPTDSVTRWQMALYLTRALAPAGGTLGAGVDQGFTDISGKSAEIQLAINQIGELGITVGKTATTFAPDDNVTREEMAMFIERFLENVKAGPGGQSDADSAASLTAAQVTYVNSDCGGTVACTGKYNYTDIDAGSVTVEGANAIKELYDLGIHDGVSATTYNPSSDMTRAAMATFMTAALAHTNARPEGLWLQASKLTNAGAHAPTLSVSDRDSSFAAVAGTPVDVFYWTTSTVEGNAAFLSTGLCDNSLATGAAITRCKIDTGEPTTNTNGNMVPTSKTTSPVGVLDGSDVFYAWTAAAATTYDNDLHGSGTDFSTLTVTATAAADETRCSIDTPANASTTTATHTMAFAAVTTISCQLTNGSAATSGSVATALRVVKLNHTRVFTTDSTGVQTGNTILINQELGLTDATGAVSFTITGPTDTAGIDNVTDTIVVTDVTGGAINNGGVLTGVSGFMTDGGATLTFALDYFDLPAAATTSALTSTATSAVASTLGVTRTYTGTVYDQYGGTVAGNAAVFSSASALPKAALCTVATPSVCTIANHGLSVGDDLVITSLGSWTGSDGTTNSLVNGADPGVTPTVGSALTVGTVPTTGTFTLLGGDGTSLDGQLINGGAGTASIAATPLVLVASSTAVAARSTSTDGTASFSWTDTEGTSGLDTITFTPTTASVSTKNFYRLATAASWIETGNNDATVDNGETLGRLVEWDSTNDDYIVQVSSNTASTDQTTVYYQYSYDSNDQFGTGGTVANPDGTAATMTAFETAMGTNALTVGGAWGDVAAVNYQALSTGVSQHYDG